MPIAGTPTGTPTGGQSLAGPSLAAGPALTRGAMPLPGQRDPWTYCVSPTRLHCIEGRILPTLAKAWHTPGSNGNSASPDSRGQGFVANLMAVGYTAVPHDIAAVAFGEDRANAQVSTYLDRYEGVSDGRKVVYYSEAWKRPRRIGHLVNWEIDRDGWLDFLQSCLDLVCPDGLIQVQVDLALEPTLRRLRAAQDREDSRGRRMMATLLRHAPTEHLPPDLADLAIEQAEALAARTAPPAKRSTRSKS
jgi:hypothetical protein